MKFSIFDGFFALLCTGWLGTAYCLLGASNLQSSVYYAGSPGTLSLFPNCWVISKPFSSTCLLCAAARAFTACDTWSIAAIQHEDLFLPVCNLNTHLFAIYPEHAKGKPCPSSLKLAHQVCPFLTITPGSRFCNLFVSATDGSTASASPALEKYEKNSRKWWMQVFANMLRPEVLVKMYHCSNGAAMYY